jgi:hypothetical protein
VDTSTLFVLAVIGIVVILALIDIGRHPRRRK